MTAPESEREDEKINKPIQRLFETQKEYYDERWRRVRLANALQASRCAAIVGAIARLEFKEPRMLDMGCGAGWLSAILGQFGPTTAVDLSEHVITQAAKAFPWVHFYSANILEWNGVSDLERFDIVVSQEVIEHVPNQAKYLRIAFDLLKEGGYLVLTTPNARTVAAMPDDLRRAWSDQPFEELVTPGHLKQMLRPLFDILECTTIIPGYGQKGLYRLASSYKLGRILSRLGLQRSFEAACLRAGFGLHTFVLARKP